MESRESGSRTRIHYEGGQYALYLWVPAGKKEAQKESARSHNRFAILAGSDEEQQPSVFARRAGEV
jgi:hypothetical protein